MLLILVFDAFIAPIPSFAQNAPQRIIQSIDVQVLNADKVIVGKVARVSGKAGAVDAAIAVQETLKGDPQLEHHLHVSDPSDSRDLADSFKKDKSRRVLIIGNRFTILDGRALDFRSADGGWIREPDKAMDYVRDLLRRNPGVTQVRTFTTDRLVVPVDTQLERRAIEAIQRRRNSTEINEGFRALELFKSDDNIAFVKMLLKDPVAESSSQDSPQYNNGYQVRHYPVRHEAYKLLSAWGVSVDEPIVSEKIAKFDSVERISWNGPLEGATLEQLAQAGRLKTLSLRDGPLTDADLQLVGRLTTLTSLQMRGLATDSGLKHLRALANLEKLDVSTSPVSDSGLRELAGLTNLRELNLSATRVTDNGVKHLAGLSKLQRLNLIQTRISDDGLTALIALPALRWVNVTLTHVTVPAIATRRSARPDLQIERSFGVALPSQEALAAYAYMGNIRNVRENLEKARIDPNADDESGTAAIIYAASQNHYDVVKLLLDRNARVDIQDTGKNTALLWAARNGNSRIIQLLLARGANVAHTNEDGNTALHLAAKHAAVEPVRLLLSAGAPPSVRNNLGQTPLDLANISGSERVKNQFK